MTVVTSASTARTSLEPSAPAAWPSVTVVVPVHDGADELASCLRALVGQDYAGPVQVVVADNASSDDPDAVVARFPGVVLVHEPRVGSYEARNTALTVANGEIVAFTDADCLPEPSWLREAVTALRQPPRAAMVGGRVLMTYEHGAPRTGSELYESVHGFPQDRYLADQHFAVTANMVTWRSVLDEVGYFDGTLRSRGDAQWGQRVHAAGLVQRYVPGAVVRHPARTTLRESVTKWRRVADGKVANDLARGCGPRHFAGLILHQLSTGIGTVCGVGHVLGRTSAASRVKYVLTASLCRAVTVSVYAAGLVRAIRGSVGRTP